MIKRTTWYNDNPQPLNPNTDPWVGGGTDDMRLGGRVGQM